MEGEQPQLGDLRSPWLLTTYKSWNDPPSTTDPSKLEYLGLGSLLFTTRGGDQKVENRGKLTQTKLISTECRWWILNHSPWSSKKWFTTGKSAQKGDWVPRTWVFTPIIFPVVNPESEQLLSWFRQNFDASPHGVRLAKINLYICNS